MQYLNEAVKGITSNELEHDFSRPDSESDKLFMSIGERDVIEVAHPSPADGVPKRYIFYKLLTMPSQSIQ